MSDGQVGLYTSAYRITNMVMIVVGSVHAAYLPALTQATRQGPSVVGGIAQRSIDVTVVFAAPIVVGGALLAAPLLSVIFGADFAGGGPAFRLLLVSLALLLVSLTVHDVILVYEQMRKEVWVVAGAAVVNAIANVALIPRYGLIGAASATLLAELLIVAGGLLIINRVGVRLAVHGSLRPLAASAMMAAALLLIGTGRSIFLLVPVGGIVYFAGLAALGGVPSESWSMVGRLLPPFAKRVR
jgi:O-antigen/teichoic acid export membrane protein